MSSSSVKLTQYSHGAGCGCKIAPSVLDSILQAAGKSDAFYPQLLVGNEERDDAAVLDLGDGTAIISTTDFFMPIVDDPETFGRIAAANAISDIYAMGGSPLMAIAILGWPITMLGPEIAGLVVRGAQTTCREAGIPLAGGHSIDSPEPIFGLAVTGRVPIDNMKKNGGAKDGDLIYLTKPLGIGILTTAQKMDRLDLAHADLAVEVMTRLNSAGERLGKMIGVHAMTDVTGFGLAGHLLEMCRASDTSAIIDFDAVPLIEADLIRYVKEGCIPGATKRNFESYGNALDIFDPLHKDILCDPQTSGGLLIAVDPDSRQEIEVFLASKGLHAKSIGYMVSMELSSVIVR